MENKDIKLSKEAIDEMKKIWFTADLHHGHPKIVEICNRPVSIEKKLLDGIPEKERNIKNKNYAWLLSQAMEEWLVKDVINPFVGKKDSIYFLGDLSLAKRNLAERFIDRLNGNKFLILGNHDKNIKNCTRFSQVTQRKNFTFSRFGLNLHIVLDHFPLASWDRKVHGSWHLYGHVHGRLKFPEMTVLDVGIDNPEILEITGGVYRPLNLYEVYLFMKKREEEIGLEKVRFENGVYG